MDFTGDDVTACVDSTVAPAYVTDREGRILGWNSAAEATLGYSREQVLGRPCHTVINGRDTFGNAVCRQDCPVKRRAAKDLPLERFRMYARAAAGHYVEVECSTLSLRNDAGDGALIHLVRPHRDRPYPDSTGGPDPPSEAERARTERLTDRETQVLHLLAAGLGTRRLADELSISPATVRSHVEAILRKLDVHSRLEAVVTALRTGLL